MQDEARGRRSRSRRDVPGRLALAVGALAALAPGCARYGLIDDGTSVAFGLSDDGMLLHPSELPVQGVGYFIPPEWRARGLRYGSDELVDLVVYTGRVMHAETGVPMAVADLALRHGGRSRWHSSHQNGLDADIIYYADDAATGAPVHVTAMRRYKPDGLARGGGPPIRFDTARNWLLVRTLIENPIARVQYIFVADWLKQRLISHALDIGEPRALVEQASYILHQPSDSLSHDDHMHVRIYCPPTDRALGCRDRGVLRWTKKSYKYPPQLARRMWPRRTIAQIERVSTRTLLALSALPFPGFVEK